MAGDSADTRRALLDAARKLFKERGFRGTTVRDIAAEAGVNQALLFRYFGSKQDVFDTVITDEGQQLLDTVTPEKLFATTLRRMVDPSAIKASEHPLYAVIRSVGEPTSLSRNDLNDDYVKKIASLSDEPDADLRADLVFAWMLGVGLLHSVLERPSLAEADPRRIVELVMDGVQTLLPRADATSADVAY